MTMDEQRFTTTVRIEITGATRDDAISELDRIMRDVLGYEAVEKIQVEPLREGILPPPTEDVTEGVGVHGAPTLEEFAELVAEGALDKDHD